MSETQPPHQTMTIHELLLALKNRRRHGVEPGVERTEVITVIGAMVDAASKCPERYTSVRWVSELAIAVLDLLATLDSAQRTNDAILTRVSDWTEWGRGPFEGQVLKVDETGRVHSIRTKHFTITIPWDGSGRVEVKGYPLPNPGTVVAFKGSEDQPAGVVAPYKRDIVIPDLYGLAANVDTHRKILNELVETTKQVAKDSLERAKVETHLNQQIQAIKDEMVRKHQHTNEMDRLANDSIGMVVKLIKDLESEVLRLRQQQSRGWFTRLISWWAGETGQQKGKDSAEETNQATGDKAEGEDAAGILGPRLWEAVEDDRAKPGH